MRMTTRIFAAVALLFAICTVTMHSAMASPPSPCWSLTSTASDLIAPREPWFVEP
jgi:hypothetical protein